MSDPSFEAGDVVKLKSGGPEMTVTSAGDTMYGEAAVFCVWFDKTEKKTGSFPPATLEKVKPSSGSFRVERG